MAFSWDMSLGHLWLVYNEIVQPFDADTRFNFDNWVLIHFFIYTYIFNNSECTFIILDRNKWVHPEVTEIGLWTVHNHYIRSPKIRKTLPVITFEQNYVILIIRLGCTGKCVVFCHEVWSPWSLKIQPSCFDLFDKLKQLGSPTDEWKM